MITKLMHQQTRQLVELFLTRPSHALLLLGPPGSGKRTLAEEISAQLLQLDVDKLDNYPYFFRLQPLPPSQEISINSVRQLIHELKHTAPAIGLIQRVLLIEEANNMSHEAQNALLKVLEEPPLNTVFILTAPTTFSVLPTVASRAQHIYVRPLSQSDARGYYGNHLSSQTEPAWQLSRGHIGLLQTLLSDEPSQPVRQSVDQAKEFLRQKQYERLLTIEKITGKVAQAQFLEGLGRILRALYIAEQAKAKPTQTKRILAGWRLVNGLQDALNGNVSPRLVGLTLVLNLNI